MSSRASTELTRLAFTVNEVQVSEAALGEIRAVNAEIAALPRVADVLALPDGVARLREGMEKFFAIPKDGGDATPDRTIWDPFVLRIFECPSPRAVFFHIHGGGWILGSAAQMDSENARLASELGVAVVSIDYRLAPEWPYTAAIDDCVNAAAWLLEHSEDQFGTRRLLIGGDSAGATLAALTLLALRDRGWPVAERFLGASLRYGAYDMTMTPSQRLTEDGIALNRRYFELSRQLLFPTLSAEQRRDPGVSPLYARLDDLPPALFTVGSLDPLLDDSWFMAGRWAQAGNVSRLDLYPETTHGFDHRNTQIAALARRRTTEFLSGCLGDQLKA